MRRKSLRSLQGLGADELDILDKIAMEVENTINSGYYGGADSFPEHEPVSLREKLGGEFVIISEIKPASPSAGKLISGGIGEVAAGMKEGGAGAISVLTEPRFFSGSLGNIGIAKKTGLPVLMKDFVLDKAQLECGKRIGADLVLLIVSLFERGYCRCSMEEMIDYAHRIGLEVLLESHSAGEFGKAQESDADILGINNRDLGTMEVSVENTINILSGARRIQTGARNGKPVISESGISSKEDVLRVKEAGAGGVLVGTSVLASGDIAGKLRGLKP